MTQHLDQRLPSVVLSRGTRGRPHLTGATPMWTASREADMAKAVITHQWAEGGAVRFAVHADAEHPDVYDELVTRVLRMYREGVLEADEAE